MMHNFKACRVFDVSEDDNCHDNDEGDGDNDYGIIVAL